MERRGIGCDSGPSLLLGRDTLSGGNEPNQPNSINSSCADGTSGTFHSDESNDRLVIQTTDGSTLAPGKTVKVSATVWAYSSFTSDHLDTLTGGSEPNQPNNINSSCADGTSGTFHSDESNDRIVVASTDGGALTHGTTVTATVWAWSTGSSDALDLYYAANPNSPTWVLIGTIVPSGGGAQSISRTYTLPTGSLQAVRANFRYQGSASSCSTGAYDDHDDLIFAVN